MRDGTHRLKVSNFEQTTAKGCGTFTGSCRYRPRQSGSAQQGRSGGLAVCRWMSVRRQERLAVLRVGRTGRLPRGRDLASILRI